MEQFFESELCIRCRGRKWCGKKCKIYSKIKNLLPKAKTHFSGSSPPEVFVGRNFYPEVYTGILAPQISGNTEEMSLPEKWHENKLSIKDIVNHRAKLVYSRFRSKVKSVRTPNKFLQTMQEISIADKSVSTEIFLKKPFEPRLNIDKHLPMIGNPAPLKKITLQENPHVKRKVDYIVSDTDNKSANAMIELHKNKTTETSNIIKILSAGMLGLKKNRRLVPTRWAVTATDDTISKHLLKRIKYYPEINEIRLFHGYYVGNHYEILLLPDKFSFEVIEAFFTGSTWNLSKQTIFTQDFERFHGRRKYAFNVTGAYYTIRLSICEYLEKIKRQAYVIIFREERPEYNAPLGVGILRELSRKALQERPETFNTIPEALNQMQTRLKLNIINFTEKSILLKEYKQQTRLNQWIK